MHILLETSAGFALFQVNNEKKLKKVDDLYSYFVNEDQAKKLVNLVAFQKFKDTTDAIKSTSKLIKGKVPKKLKKFLQTNLISQEIQDRLAISDKKLGKSITEKLGIECTNYNMDLFKGLRLQLCNMVAGLTEKELQTMNLGLSHGLSRYKLKFSAEKVDTMIIQAISLLDDLEKEVNNYMMRLREWYGWHFPEMGKIVTDSLVYTKVVLAVGMRTKAHSSDLSGILPEDIEKEVKQAAEISMGTEISEEDEKFILELGSQIVDLSEYKEELQNYLKNRMQTIAPNLSAMLGELVGARLISHAGSLINLAKYPASTVQILGAEKALFKAIKTKMNTPKYGLIYQASIVGQAQNKLKGKISRTLAAKTALCIRCDALGEDDEAQIGAESRQYVEKRLQFLQQNEQGGFVAKPQKKGASAIESKSTGGYNNAADYTNKFRKSNETLGQNQEEPQKVKKFKKD
ncbi:hypothetical protein IMG5_160580 [Ichthyophthirius multifiliis]|uniref:Nop domain-containing protein n=1 Tax=Ichthyophthirius multifiliis TaxID=5932 RepID=G0QZY8_ICHMU|nr:hypothetical protein IMG5_160580 [Ichthyophthirius multifiliis]EGR29221.1 hypothetical protein IMG5_160580 [Ichthyophthirius multifiliis]|eukprot:XP_004030457.1 hypothetical protein IMG5_160580 [Ichthyophthirius multifiliis]